MLDLTRLRSFAEVVERGTIAAAAESLGFTAPAVSQHLAKLEAELRTTLFDRAGRRLRLSEEGAALLPIALEMLDLETRARHIVHDHDGTPHHTIAGFASAIATIVVPRLHDLGSTMKLQVTEAEDEAAMRDLSLGGVDLVLAQEYDDMPEDRNPRFDFTPLATDELRLVLPPSFSSSTTVDQLGASDWLLNGDGTRCAAATLRILQAHRIRPSISGTVTDNETLLGLVSAGHGVTIAPDLLLRDRSLDVTVARQPLGITRTIYAVTRAASAAATRPLVELLMR